MNIDESKLRPDERNLVRIGNTAELLDRLTQARPSVEDVAVAEMVAARHAHSSYPHDPPDDLVLARAILRAAGEEL